MWEKEKKKSKRKKRETERELLDFSTKENPRATNIYTI